MWQTCDTEIAGIFQYHYDFVLYDARVKMMENEVHSSIKFYTLNAW